MGKFFPICKKAYEAGLRRVCDITTEKGHFIPYNDLIRVYGQCIDFLTYYGIVSSIKKEWKQLLQEPDQKSPNVNKAKAKVNDFLCTIKTLTAKQICKCFNSWRFNYLE